MGSDDVMSHGPHVPLLQRLEGAIPLDDARFFGISEWREFENQFAGALLLYTT